MIVSATYEEFVLMFGLIEATELSNLDDANATEPNRARIELALSDASVWLQNHYDAAPMVAKTFVASSSRRTTAVIARYYLDITRTRENVRYDYENAIKELESQTSRAEQLGAWYGRHVIGAGQSVATGEYIPLIHFGNLR